jgi:predicted unusual protein kinase regulating ubiquinone biosynthesis (AarF/ABC1/UbiB family)
MPTSFFLCFFLIDFLPTILFKQALSDLHDKVLPFPRETAIKIIEGELGCPLDKKFSYISDQPVAAASFGQVLIFFYK